MPAGCISARGGPEPACPHREDVRGMVLTVERGAIAGVRETSLGLPASTPKRIGVTHVLTRLAPADQALNDLVDEPDRRLFHLDFLT